VVTRRSSVLAAADCILAIVTKAGPGSSPPGAQSDG
jgi:hypothetical protein